MAAAGLRWRRPGRPLTRAASLGTAAHVFHELGSGVGMPLASVVGPLPAAAAWTTGTAAVVGSAGRADGSHDRAFASLNGVYLSVIIGHYVAWPWTRKWLPWLADCEGLGADRMPVYNAILYVSGGAALAGLLLENRGGPRLRCRAAGGPGPGGGPRPAQRVPAPAGAGLAAPRLVEPAVAPRRAVRLSRSA